MRKGNVELLAPAGSYEALVAAIQAGANAVYIGGLQFGARAFANNFDDETMVKAIEYCHGHNVLLYVTVNTLYDDLQFDELIAYLTFLYETGVDAFIIQDMGLFYLVKQYFPDVEIHISTQASVRNLAGVQYFESQDADRVVLAREMKIYEIYEIGHHTNIDLEVFVHGALCMSYSGQCLMSSMIAKRSGNKGKCGQPCRLPYDLLEDGKVISDHKNRYLLSPQDLCTIEHVNELIEAGIKSFKVEGRMKRPEYVYTVIAAYRKAIDDYFAHQQSNLQNEIADMKKMFNRGFTEGFLFQNSLELSKSIPGHQGIEIADIVTYNSKKKTLTMKLKDVLFQNDRIYFPEDDLTRTITKLFKNGKLTAKADRGEVVTIELNNKVNLKQNVYKVLDSQLISEVNQRLKKENIKSAISMELNAKIDAPLQLKVSDGIYNVVLKSEELVENARQTPLSKERIIQQLSKLGNTVYYVDDIQVHFPENGIISIKVLNELRRKAIQDLDKKRQSHRRSLSLIELPELTWQKRKNKKLAVKIHDITQAAHLDLQLIDQLFVPFNQYKSYHEKMIPYVPFLYDEKELEAFMMTKEYHKVKKIMVSDFGACQLIGTEKEIIFNYHFNLTNSHALCQFTGDCVLSLELNKNQINHLKAKQNLYFIAYSKNINMNLKHCIISDHYFGYKNKHCSLCRQHHYQLKDRMNKRFDIITDRYCNNYILNDRTLYIEDLENLNVDFILLDFNFEDAMLVDSVVRDFNNHILCNKKSEIIHNFDTFRGYY